jgi:Glycosyl transferase family 2
MPAPYLSVIVELDNVLHGEVTRAQTMLGRLLDQIRENKLEPRVEVLVMYDETVIRSRDVRRIVTPTITEENPFVLVVPTAGLRYFDLKNEGGRRARGDILLFVDSDCLPEDKWLRRLLDSFDSPEVDVVTGNSYIDRDTFYAKTFAVGWYFPPRLPDGPLVTTLKTFANTLAMRRHIFERYPFPDKTSLYMAQSATWHRTLTANAVRIFLNPGARVAHPPPVFLRSAIVNGYDAAQRTRQPGDSWLQGLRVSCCSLRGNLIATVRRITRDYREVGIPRASVPLAIALAGAYWTLWSMAELVTHWAPGLIPHKHLR